MEIQLQDIISQIKKEGVQEAQKQAEAIIADARAQADKLVADAQMQADRLMLHAKEENERAARSAEDAIRQAGRNLLISFRESVAREMRAIVGENVASVYQKDALAPLVLGVVESWAKKPEAEDLTVILNSDDLKALESELLAGLKERMLSGVTLKANDNFDGGFRIAVSNGSAYYDYSAQAVTDMMSGYLSPKVTSLLKEAE